MSATTTAIRVGPLTTPDPHPTATTTGGDR